MRKCPITLGSRINVLVIVEIVDDFETYFVFMQRMLSLTIADAALVDGAIFPA